MDWAIVSIHPFITMTHGSGFHMVTHSRVLMNGHDVPIVIGRSMWGSITEPLEQIANDNHDLAAAHARV